ncbi:MAG: hypothetical protein Q7J32_05790 [Sphingomonadaceae bacterium]|nr:hypothetical protein [Sphingomonadaceae bacterium]
MRGLKRGLLGGLLLALIVFFLPDGLLGAVTVGTGLASVLPAAAPPLGTTARLLLAVVALLFGFALTFWLVRRSRPSWDVDDSTDAEPLPAFEQMVVSPAPLMARADDAATPVSPRTVDTSGIDARLSRLEAAIADVPAQIARAAKAAPAGDDTASVLARVEALETQLGERLADIDARLATGDVTAPGYAPRPLRTPAHIGDALANIRRTIDGA